MKTQKDYAHQPETDDPSILQHNNELKMVAQEVEHKSLKSSGPKLSSIEKQGILETKITWDYFGQKLFSYTNWKINFIMLD